MSRAEGLGVDDVVGLSGFQRPLHLDGDHAGYHDRCQLDDGLVDRLSHRRERVVRLHVVAVVESNGADVVASFRDVLVVVERGERDVLVDFEGQPDLLG